MNVFGRIMRAVLTNEAPDSDFWYKPVPSRPGYVSEDSALRIAAVWACVRVISETIASLPCQVYKREGDGRRLDRDHALYRILHDAPNDYMTSFELWELAGKHLCTYGNFYAQIIMDNRATVMELRPLPPDMVSVSRDSQTGVLVYTVRSGAKTEVYAASEILHVPGLGYDGVGNLVGFSPVEYCRQSMVLAADAESYGTNFFANNATPPAYVSIPQALNDEGFARLEKWFKGKFGGVKNAGKLGILDQGGEIKTVPINHRDMQFLELRKYQVEEIARIYRVPLHLIQSLDRATNNNIEQQALDFVQNTIRPWLVRIERRLNMQLFGPREGRTWYAEFNMDAMLRGDMEARGKYYSALRNIGVLNGNEIRAKENMNPYDGGEVYMVQGAMVPVDMAGQFMTRGN
jgi:HK97 family phage portal protein